MAKIQRVPVKVFGSDGPSSQFAQYGSLMEGQPQKTKDLASIQGLATYLQGMFPATAGGDKPPAIEDENALRYLFSSLIAYIYQEGIPEWDKDTEYYVNSLVKEQGIIYRALKGNINQPVFVSGNLNSTNWTRDYVLGQEFIAELALKANLASPTFTGTVKVPSKTAAAGSDGTLIATEAQVNLKANLASPTFTGTPKVPSKTTAAGSDGTLIATEAQVALKANLSSPALSGTPTAPEIVTIPHVKNPNTSVLNDWGNQIVSMNTLRNAILNRVSPINSYYTQYPIVGASDLATMFPDTHKPANLFGGTWTEEFLADEVYFRTGQLGSHRGQKWDANTNPQWQAGGTPGVELDASRNIIADITNPESAKYGAGILGQTLDDIFAGAMYSSGIKTGNWAWGTPGADGRYAEIHFDASRVAPTDTTNHPKNRLIKVWRRTA